MLNDNAKKWVEALRSGKFQQAKNRLATKDGFCCLGVACEVAIENGVEIKKIVVDTGGILYDYNEMLLPDSVKEWLNLTTCGSDYEVIGNAQQLSADNDSGKTFTKIADIIESEPEGLFNNLVKETK